MNIRDLHDNIRETLMEKPNMFPSREISYTRISDDVGGTLNALIGAGVFNKVEKDKIDEYQSFGNLKLEVKPKPLDDIIYDGIAWKVRRWTKLGTLYTVYCEKSRRTR